MPPDGVVVLNGMIDTLDGPTALSAVELNVTDADQSPVTGSLELIDELGPAYAEASSRVATVIWRPDAPLESDSDYSVTWSVKSEFSFGAQNANIGTVALHTVGVGAPLAAPTTTGSELTESVVWSGSLVTCAIAPVAQCGSGSTYEFFENGTITTSLSVMVMPALSESSSTYQLFELQPVPGKGTSAEPSQRLVFAATQGPASVTQALPLTLAFSDSRSEYCARLVTTDLRDGTTLTSEEICASGPVKELDGTTTALASCEAPPSQGLTALWCRSPNNADAPACQQLADEDSSAGCACSTPHRPGSNAAALALLLAASIAGLRRRRGISLGDPSRHG